jgi:hypothetical protein
LERIVKQLVHIDLDGFEHGSGAGEIEQISRLFRCAICLAAASFEEARVLDRFPVPFQKHLRIAGYAG